MAVEKGTQREIAKRLDVTPQFVHLAVTYGMYKSEKAKKARKLYAQALKKKANRLTTIAA